MAKVKLGALRWKMHTDWSSLLEARGRAHHLGCDGAWTGGDK
jgi:hypothetical protein